MSWQTISVKAYIDNFFVNIYLNTILETIEKSQKCKIIFIKNKIKLNPSYNKIFKNFYDYFKNGIEKMEKISEFGILETLKIDDGDFKKHISKIYNIFDNETKNPLILIYNETKSKIIIDKNEKKIEGFLQDTGSKDKNFIIYKIGPIITNKNNTILKELNFKTLKNLKEFKNNSSWKTVNDLFL